MEGRAGPWGGSNVYVSPETLANSIREALPRTHTKFQFSAKSLEEQGMDSWFFWEEGMRENNMPEAWLRK